MMYRHPIIIAYYLIPGLWVPSSLGSLGSLASKVKEPKGEGTQRRGNPKANEPKIPGLWVPSPLGSLTFGFPDFQRWRNPKAREPKGAEPKGEGIQNPWPLGSFAFGFPGFWVPKARTQRRGNPKAAMQGAQNPWPLGSFVFGFPGFWVPKARTQSWQVYELLFPIGSRTH